ncbi:hypothetical protein [Alkalitalea saponilacus]|uniref:WD40-like Beta Propeller Repeat n=1 Tax=Alkalitalea saponilacus TaxID=889453 RepID=A0A1T5A618_9BACT|nr:hypothetical protein [Alkalitalea saponilacus]ASB48835.1 hypothetical protein CDL62_06665 [Alkalitalea saponilacus]SKB30378.1 hypothetical protein SAMN03080601_00104 [Alkalitalea saponilacus]
MKTHIVNFLLVASWLIIQAMLLPITAQTVNLNGISVTIDDIPLSWKGLNVNVDNELKSTNQGIKEHPVVFKSSNGKFLAKATNVEVLDPEILKSSTGSDKAVSKIELFTDDGVLIYSKELDYKVLRASISDDGKYSHVMIYEYTYLSENDYSELKVLDSKGNQLKSVPDVGNYAATNDNGVYYLKNEKDNDQIRFFGYFNMENNTSWEQPVDIQSSLSSVSQDGSHVALTSTNYPGLQSFNSAGTLLWSNPEILGGNWDTALSPNGNYLLFRKGRERYIIFDNLTGDFISSIRPFEVNGELMNFRTGCFIDNSEDRILNSSTVRINGEIRTVLSEHNLRGELIRKAIVQSTVIGYRLSAVLNNDNTISVFLDGLEDVRLNSEFETFSF